MATEIVEAPEISTEDAPKANPRTGQTALTLSFSLLAGTGLTLMIIAIAWGVVDGNANGDIVGILLAGGLGMMVGGIGAWAGLLRPWESFDDINEPHYTGHHHEEDHHDDDEH